MSPNMKSVPILHFFLVLLRGAHSKLGISGGPQLPACLSQPASGTGPGKVAGFFLYLGALTGAWWSVILWSLSRGLRAPGVAVMP